MCVGFSSLPCVIPQGCLLRQSVPVGVYPWCDSLLCACVKKCVFRSLFFVWEFCAVSNEPSHDGFYERLFNFWKCKKKTSFLGVFFFSEFFLGVRKDPQKSVAVTQQLF